MHIVDQTCIYFNIQIKATHNVINLLTSYKFMKKCMSLRYINVSQYANTRLLEQGLNSQV